MSAESEIQPFERFADLSDREIDEFLLTKNSAKTKQSTHMAFKTFSSFVSDKLPNLIAVLVDVTEEGPTSTDNFVKELNECLGKFYVGVRNRLGEDYKTSTLRAMKFGLARHYKDKHEVDTNENPV